MPGQAGNDDGICKVPPFINGEVWEGPFFERGKQEQSSKAYPWKSA